MVQSKYTLFFSKVGDFFGKMQKLINFAKNAVFKV